MYVADCKRLCCIFEIKYGERLTVKPFFLIDDGVIDFDLQNLSLLLCFSVEHIHSKTSHYLSAIQCLNATVLTLIYNKSQSK